MPLSIVPAPPAGTAYVYTALADCINASWTNASDMQTAYSAKVLTASGTWLDPTTNPQHIVATTVTPAAVTEPAATAQASDALTLYATEKAALVTLLDGKIPTFMAAWFPTDASVFDAAESWLLAEINNPDRVLPAALASVIWEEDRSRIMQDTQRASDAVFASFAARRFPMPPGAAASAILQVQQKAQDQLAASSRNVAVKTFEMAFDKLKFCIGQAVATRQMAMGAALDYIKVLATAPALGTQAIGMAYSAESALRGAASQFIGARAEAAKLAYAGAEYNARATQGAAEKNQMADLTMLGEKLKALIAEAQGIAQLATAWANNLHASTGVQGNDSVVTNI